MNIPIRSADLDLMADDVQSTSPVGLLHGLPPGPVGDVHRRPLTDRIPRRWRLPLVLVVAIGVVSCIAFAFWWFFLPHGNGDPGGQILTRIESEARAVIPPQAKNVMLSGTDEPTWIGSCNDLYFAQGWGPVDAAYTFRSTERVSQVESGISRGLARMGWMVDAGGPRAWTRQLPNGESEHLALIPPYSPGPTFWEISVQSTPVSPVGECSGP